MPKLLIGGFLVAHGLVHMGVWATPKSDGPQPFDPSHSWLLEAMGIDAGMARTVSVILAIGAALGFVASGGALLLGSDWWRVIAMVTAAEALPLFIIFFNPWLTLGVVIQVAILYSLVVSHWPPESALGA